jgi:heme A synthase
MKKLGVFILFLFCSIIIAGSYGILHDQITYSISPEYFTKFKYEQFGFEPSWFGGDRQTVAVIGFLATWWMGLIIGVILGIVAFIFPDYKTMAKALRKSIILIFCIAACSALAGGLYGRFYLAHTQVNWWLPEDLIDRKAFITVGSIHNFSYLGGVLGIIASIFYLVYLNRNYRDKTKGR